MFYVTEIFPFLSSKLHLWITTGVKVVGIEGNKKINNVPLQRTERTLQEMVEKTEETQHFT